MRQLLNYFVTMERISDPCSIFPCILLYCCVFVFSCSYYFYCSLLCMQVSMGQPNLYFCHFKWKNDIPYILYCYLFSVLSNVGCFGYFQLFAIILSYTEYYVHFCSKLYFCLYELHGVYFPKWDKELTAVLQFWLHITLLLSRDTEPIYNPTRGVRHAGFPTA